MTCQHLHTETEVLAYKDTERMVEVCLDCKQELEQPDEWERYENE